MSFVYVPICIKCSNFNNFEKGKNGRANCKAYPDGIPYEVWKEKSKPDVDVNAPCPNGYKFEHD